MTVSIIIPLYKEKSFLLSVVKHLRRNAITDRIREIIICEFETISEAESKKYTDVRFIHCDVRGRAAQLNRGIAESQGEILYFLHADSFPPHGFDKLILDAVDAGSPAGCFRLRFDYNHWFLNLSAWFTRFGGYVFHGGDQSLFIKRDLCLKMGGYNEEMKIMEDYDFVRRLKKYSQFKIIKSPIVTSAKKYLTHGTLKLQIFYGYIHLLYACNVSQKKLVHLYTKYIK